MTDKPLPLAYVRVTVELCNGPQVRRYGRAIMGLEGSSWRSEATNEIGHIPIRDADQAAARAHLAAWLRTEADRIENTPMQVKESA